MPARFIDLNGTLISARKIILITTQPIQENNPREKCIVNVTTDISTYMFRVPEECNKVSDRLFRILNF